MSAARSLNMRSSIEPNRQRFRLREVLQLTLQAYSSLLTR